MSDGDRTPLDLEPWQHAARFQLSAGSSAEWEYPIIGSVLGLLGDRLEVRPVVILKRFANEVEVLVGCRMLQLNGQVRLESTCLLNADDIHSLLNMTSEVAPCDQPSPQKVTLMTRSGFKLEWASHVLVYASVACQRQIELDPAGLTRLRQFWVDCLDFLNSIRPKV